MTLTVITPPAPIITPEEIPGSHDANDARIAAMIAAAQEVVDGPSGWLGRAIGPQVLELAADCWGNRSFRLPCPPLIGIVSVTYRDAAGVEQTVLAADYALASDRLWFQPAWAAPSLGRIPSPIRIRFKAGYNGTTGAGAGEAQTGPVPERAKQAVILAVQEMQRNSAVSMGLRSETVEGVGAQTFMDNDRIAGIVKNASEALLSGLRVYSL